MRNVFLVLVLLWLTSAAVSAQSIVVSSNRNSLAVSGMLAGASAPVPDLQDPIAADIAREIAADAAVVPQAPEQPAAGTPSRDAELEQLRQEIRELQSLLSGDGLAALNLPQTPTGAEKPVLDIYTQKSGCAPCEQMKKAIAAGCFAGCQLRYFYSGAERYPTIKCTDTSGRQRTFVGWSSQVPEQIRQAVGLPAAAALASVESDPEPLPDSPAAVSLQYRSQWPPMWNVEGKWNASRDFYLSHLRNHPNHRGKFWQAYPLETWSREQLAALHDDDHNGRVARLDGTTSIARQSIMTTARQPAARSSMPIRRSSPLRMRSCPTCPGGSCP